MAADVPGNEVPHQRADAPAMAPAARPRRSGLAVLALLLALVAAAGTAFLYWRLLWQDRTDEADARLDGLQAELGQRLARIKDDVTRQIDLELGPELQNLQQRDRTADERLEAIESAVASLLTAPSRELPASLDDWKAAEAGYLLRIAHHRLLMEADPQGALDMLRQADALFAEAAGGQYHAVREALAREILALESLGEAVDVEGVFLALEALKGSLRDALGPVPEDEMRRGATAPTPGAGSATASAWEALADRLTELARIRRVDAASVRPLPEAEEQLYRERRMRLALDQAQLALLRRKQSVYDASLRNVRDELAAAGNEGGPARQAFLDALAPLQVVRVEQSLPDISGSLQAFQSAQTRLGDRP